MSMVADGHGQKCQLTLVATPATTEGTMKQQGDVGPVSIPRSHLSHRVIVRIEKEEEPCT